MFSFFTHFFTATIFSVAKPRSLFFPLIALLLCTGGCAPLSAALEEQKSVAPSPSRPKAAETAESGAASSRAVRRAIACGTVITLEAAGPEAEDALDETLARLHALDALLDAENPASDIARLNAAAGRESVPIAPETQRLLSRSKKYAAQTKGAWDITVGPLTQLWRDALARRVVPQKADVEAARIHVDWQQLDLTDSHAYLPAGMAVDPGGALKGLAIDEARRIFTDHHIESGLISLGTSSLCAVGEKTPGRPWQIALRHPRREPSEPLGVLSLSNALLAVSGDYEHFFAADGRRYHHIIDPRTGWPVENGVAEVVLCLPPEDPEAGLNADILSTALFVLGEDGVSLLPDGASALFVNADGTITVYGVPLSVTP